MRDSLVAVSGAGFRRFPPDVPAAAFAGVTAGANIINLVDGNAEDPRAWDISKGAEVPAHTDNNAVRR